ATVGISAGAARGYGAAPPPPKEGGLSWEGLLTGHPGFHQRTAAPLPFEELPGFLSRAQLAAHQAEDEKQVEGRKDTEQALTSVGRDPTDVAAYGALRRRQVASANDVLLHDFY